MDILEQKPMTVLEVIRQNNEILRTLRFSPDQREDYDKICGVIANNNMCIEAMERADAEAKARADAEAKARAAADAELQEVIEDADPEAE